MDIVIILLALGMLMFAAYRGFSVILFAPICALFAVLLTDPSFVLPFFSNIFMEKMVGFIKLYFPVFLLGSFGKVVEISGLAESIAKQSSGLWEQKSHSRHRLNGCDFNVQRRQSLRSGVCHLSVC